MDYFSPDGKKLKSGKKVPGIWLGKELKRGDFLWMSGKTGTNAYHLHYEVIKIKKWQSVSRISSSTLPTRAWIDPKITLAGWRSTKTNIPTLSNEKYDWSRWDYIWTTSQPLVEYGSYPEEYIEPNLWDDKTYSLDQIEQKSRFSKQTPFNFEDNRNEKYKKVPKFNF